MPRKRVHGTNVHDSSRAEWLAEKLGRRWRYDNVTGDWYGYDGVIWRLSRANAVAVDAMNVAAKHLSGCPEEGIERIDNESLRETIEKLLEKLLSRLGAKRQPAIEAPAEKGAVS